MEGENLSSQAQDSGASGLGPWGRLVSSYPESLTSRVGDQGGDKGLPFSHLPVGTCPAAPRQAPHCAPATHSLSPGRWSSPPSPAPLHASSSLQKHPHLSSSISPEPAFSAPWLPSPHHGPPRHPSHPLPCHWQHPGPQLCYKRIPKGHQ